MRTINDPTEDDLIQIASELCDSDRTELALTRDPDDYMLLAHDAWDSPYKKVVLDNGEPVMAFGARQILDNSAAVWGFKTEKGWSAVRTATKHITRVMIPALREMGVREAVCFVHPDNQASQRWLEHLGFRPKAILQGFGSRRGDSIVLYAREEPDALH